MKNREFFSLTLMLQTKEEKTESWQHNPRLNITNIEICISAALDYLKRIHLPPQDPKDNCNHSNTAFPQPLLKDTTWQRCFIKTKYTGDTTWKYVSQNSSGTSKSTPPANNKANFTNITFSGYKHVIFTLLCTCNYLLYN